MYLQHLTVQNVRNIALGVLEPSPALNLIHGPNGSGKTSLLEAIHLLLMGRSFRNHHRFRSLVQEGTAESLVVGKLNDGIGSVNTVGVRRNVAEKPEVKLNGERLRSIAELAQVAPVQVLDSELIELIVGPPSGRRQLLDWGLFHVEHDFLPIWRKADRALKQRNGALRHGKIGRPQAELWSQLYAQFGAQLSQRRELYARKLGYQVSCILSELEPLLADQVRLEYSRGWSGDEASLLRQLLDGIERDVQVGQTRVGAHRADIKIRVANAMAGDVLSRGQLKLVSAAVRLAQVRLLNAETGKTGLVLVDDLPAELDRRYRSALWRSLEMTPGQHFVTCVEPEELAHSWGTESPPLMFHVEHGSVS